MNVDGEHVEGNNNNSQNESNNRGNANGVSVGGSAMTVPQQQQQQQQPRLQVAPGLEAVHNVCKELYPEQINPLTVTAIVKYW